MQGSAVENYLPSSSLRLKASRKKLFTESKLKKNIDPLSSCIAEIDGSSAEKLRLGQGSSFTEFLCSCRVDRSFPESDSNCRCESSLACSLFLN